MQVFLLKSKIHRATVTGGNVKYEGSLTIAADLMEKCALQEYEKILCGNMANGERFETYAIKGRRGSGEIILNGAVSHLGKKGDLLTIMCFAAFSAREARNWNPRVVVLGKKNRVEIVKRGI
jgi:aspartate 1-decarboxylase